MRDILFRGKRVDNEEWVYGSLVNNLWGKGDEKVCEIVTTDVDYYDCWEDLIFGAIVEVIPETVGQFTGLLDKNGDRIFEGDVLNTKTTFENNMDDKRFQSKTEVIVSFSLGCFVDQNTDFHLFDVIKCIVNKTIDYEIIGNIHDNEK